MPAPDKTKEGKISMKNLQSTNPDFFFYQLIFDIQTHDQYTQIQTKPNTKTHTHKKHLNIQIKKNPVASVGRFWLI